MSSMELPKYGHNCDSCVYYGNSRGLDVYLCNPYREESNRSSRNITVLIRYGEEESEYYSTAIENLFNDSVNEYKSAAHEVLSNLPIYKLVEEYCFKRDLLDIVKDRYLYPMSMKLGKGDIEQTCDMLRDCLDMIYFTEEELRKEWEAKFRKGKS